MLRKRSNGENDGSDDRRKPRAPRNPLDGLFDGYGPDQSEIEKLRRELDKAKEQIELQQFQLVNLRRDLEHSKINALIVTLGGAHPELDQHTPKTGEQSEEDSQEDEFETLLDFEEPGDDDGYLDALCEWIASEEEPEEEPARETAGNLTAVDDADAVEEPADAETETPGAPEDVSPEVTGEETANAVAEIDSLEPQASGLDVDGIQINLQACLDTIELLAGRIDEQHRHIKNRDVHIQLLKEKIEINEDNLRNNYVSAREFEDLKQRLEEYRSVKRTLEIELRIKEDVEQRLAEAKEAHEIALKEIEDYRAKLENIEAGHLEKTAAIESEWREREATAAEEHERLKKQVEELTAELDHSKDFADKAIAHHTERLRKEYSDMRALLQQHDESMRRLRDDVERLQKENAGLNSENKELILELNSSRRKSESLLVENYAGMKQKLAEKFAENTSPGVLLEMRQFFIETKQYIDAVRTFRQLLVDPKNQKLMPAVCLLVGEFYKLAGRKEEAAFYLANPLIREDSYAQYLLRKITGKGDA